MRIFVTGWHSQIARALLEIAPAAPSVSGLAVGRPALEISRLSGIRGAMMAGRPDVIINAAAYTGVDQAEDEQEEAYALNEHGAAELAEIAARQNVPVIHISSVYVFDGSKEGPYVEEDAPCPPGVYGRTRLAGERAIAETNPRHVILRTGWVYSEHGSNFVTRMLRRARNEETIDVVEDQFGSPTYARDIAAAILDIAGAVARDGGDSRWGVYHAAGEGRTSWHGFAERLFELSRASGGPFPRLNQTAGKSYATSAPRLKNAELDCSKLQDAFGIRLPHWSQSLEACVSRCLAAEKAGQD